MDLAPYSGSGQLVRQGADRDRGSPFVVQKRVMAVLEI